MSKRKIFYSIVGLLLIFFILGTATVGKNTDPFSQFLKSLLPLQPGLRRQGPCEFV